MIYKYLTIDNPDFTILYELKKFESSLKETNSEILIYIKLKMIEGKQFSTIQKAILFHN